MAREPATPDRAVAIQKLADLWSVALSGANLSASGAVRELVNSRQTAIRFCLPTLCVGHESMMGWRKCPIGSSGRNCSRSSAT